MLMLVRLLRAGRRSLALHRHVHALPHPLVHLSHLLMHLTHLLHHLLHRAHHFLHLCFARPLRRGSRMLARRLVLLMR